MKNLVRKSTTQKVSDSEWKKAGMVRISVRGNAGCGKSTIIAFLEKHLPQQEKAFVIVGVGRVTEDGEEMCVIRKGKVRA